MKFFYLLLPEVDQSPPMERICPQGRCRFLDILLGSSFWHEIWVYLQEVRRSPMMFRFYPIWLIWEGEHNYWLYILLIIIAYNRVVSLSVEVVGKKFWVAGSEVEEIVRTHV